MAAKWKTQQKLPKVRSIVLETWATWLLLASPQRRKHCDKSRRRTLSDASLVKPLSRSEAEGATSSHPQVCKQLKIWLRLFFFHVCKHEVFVWCEYVWLNMIAAIIYCVIHVLFTHTHSVICFTYRRGRTIDWGRLETCGTIWKMKLWQKLFIITIRHQRWISLKKKSRLKCVNIKECVSCVFIIQEVVLFVEIFHHGVKFPPEKNVTMFWYD